MSGAPVGLEIHTNRLVFTLHFASIPDSVRWFEARRLIRSLLFNNIALGRKEFPDAVKMRIGAGSRTAAVMEAMVAQCQGMEFALYAHSAHLLPTLDGIH